MKKPDDKIFSELAKKIAEYEVIEKAVDTGEILSLGDGIASLSGMSQAKMGEIVTFPGKIEGVVINLRKDEAGVIILGDFLKLKEGDIAKTTGKLLSVEATYNLLGRIINPLSLPLDGKGPVLHGNDTKEMLVERIAPGILFRKSVDTPLQTGIKAVDAMIPIGRGQRELIIGDRNTGKTTIATDTIINQAALNRKKGAKKVICIYVSIGQKQSKVVQLVQKLEQYGAMAETIIISASSSDPVSLQYLAPYSGCAIAEYFMEKGEDVLIVYDDLTKHAWAYRQISLTLRRPSGREAYPGDIFYLHSRLLERACKLDDKYGGGSITALPIIETQAQDISAYIPTNVISITDGQIYLEPDLFYQGVRPAINVGLSVSRVGGKAQLKSMKQVAGRLRLELAQYNELSAFAQFGSDLDPASLEIIERGKRLIKILNQSQYSPVELQNQLILIWFVTKGFLDNVEVDKCLDMSYEFVDFVKAEFPKLEEAVYSKEGIDKSVEEKLEKLAARFKKL